MMNLKSGVAIATAAAAVFASGMLVTPMAKAADGDVKCAGANSCKGTSECKSAKNECKGQNSCKGQGWIGAKSEKACMDMGGKVVK